MLPPLSNAPNLYPSKTIFILINLIQKFCLCCLPFRDYLEEMREHNQQENDWREPLTMPAPLMSVILNPQDPNVCQHYQFTFEFLKNFRKSVAANGMHAPFTDMI